MADALKPMGSSASGGLWRGRREKAALSGGALLFLLGALWGVGGTTCWGEQKPDSKLLFLVARPSIADPFFSRSVVLMLPIKGEPVIVGLVVNKPTRLPLIKLFPESPTLKNSSDAAYMGGPVDMSSPALVFHAPKPPKKALQLYDDVYLTFDPEFISKRMQNPKQTGDLRLFLGRAQWGPKQLQDEALEGSWYSLRAEGEVIFDRDSEHLWKRLHDRARPPSNVENWMVQPTRAMSRVPPTNFPPPLFSPL